MAVFVLDQRHKPLMPCSEKRARLLLQRQRAVVHRRMPFIIRLLDRARAQSTVPPLALKLDPGSKTSGIALVGVEEREEGEVHHALHLATLSHRGEQVHQALQQPAGYRRRRRCANLRHRPPRLRNRRRAEHWLPPSLRSRIGDGLTWAQRYQRWAPVSRIEVERVKFDTQLLEHPEVEGVASQGGELCGWELGSSLLSKFGHRCLYCGGGQMAFESEHVVPKSRGGSDRVSNLVLSCHECTEAKGNRTAAELGYPQVQAQARTPLKDAAAMNAARFALVEALRQVGLPMGTWSGRRTRGKRARFGIEKDHCLDALCVGELVGVELPAFCILPIRAQGRGSHQRTNVDASGFPRGYLTRQKRIRGFSRGDLAQAVVPAPLKTAGVHVGRVAVRKTGSFRVGKVDGINAKYLSVIQRADGYDYARGQGRGAGPRPAPLPQGTPASCPRINSGASAGGGG